MKLKSLWRYLQNPVKVSVNLADFLETSQIKLVVIWIKSVKNTGFFGPDISSKITVTKEKESRKRKSEEKEGRRREKKQRLHS